MPVTTSTLVHTYSNQTTTSATINTSTFTMNTYSNSTPHPLLLVHQGSGNNTSETSTTMKAILRSKTLPTTPTSTSTTHYNLSTKSSMGRLNLGLSGDRMSRLSEIEKQTPSPQPQQQIANNNSIHTHRHSNSMTYTNYTNDLMDSNYYSSNQKTNYQNRNSVNSISKKPSLSIKTRLSSSSLMSTKITSPVNPLFHNATNTTTNSAKSSMNMGYYTNHTASPALTHSSSVSSTGSTTSSTSTNGSCFYASNTTNSTISTNSTGTYRPLSSGIIGFTAEMVAAVIPCSGYNATHTKTRYLPELLPFISKVTRKCRLDLRTLLYALIYTKRFGDALSRQGKTSARGEYGTCHRIFLAAVLLAHKAQIHSIQSTNTPSNPTQLDQNYSVTTTNMYNNNENLYNTTANNYTNQPLNVSGLNANAMLDGKAKLLSDCTDGIWSVKDIEMMERALAATIGFSEIVMDEATVKSFVEEHRAELCWFR